VDEPIEPANNAERREFSLQPVRRRDERREETGDAGRAGAEALGERCQILVCQAVGPVNILDHEQQRPSRARVPDQPGNRLAPAAVAPVARVVRGREGFQPVLTRLIPILDRLEARGLLAYAREKDGRRYLIALNLGSQPQTLGAAGRVVLSTFLDRENEPVGETLDLRGDEGLIIETVRRPGRRS
jgi:hypothetical protein